MDAKLQAQESEDSILTSMVARLKRFDIRLNNYPETSKHFRRAAVLMPVTIRNGEPFLLLTKRSKELRTHPSLVALPGGHRENCDTSDIDTALREAEEEINLPRSSVRVLAVLTRSIAIPNNVVYPVVGLIPNDFQPEKNPHEVEATFYIPLREFLSDSVTKFHVKVQGKVFPTLSLNYDNGEEIFVIFGLTIFLCILLARIVFDQNPEETEKLIQEYFRHICQMFLSNSLSRL